MKNLKKINHEYIQLREAAESSMSNSDWAKHKTLQIEVENKCETFLLAAKEHTIANKISPNDLIISFIHKIRTKEQSSIHLFLLLNLIWDSDIIVTKNFVEEIETLTIHLTASGKILSHQDYYIEMLIDWLNYNTEQPIRVEILKKVLLLEYTDENKYASYVKAISYLQHHPAETINAIHDKIKATKKYQSDDYYQDWIE